MMIPLHLPSHWSPGHGATSPADLVDYAERWGLPALALTDLETLSGAVEFHQRCRARGVRPILGVELRRGFVSVGFRGRPGSRAGRLVLVARNREGYRSLCRIVSRRRTLPTGVASGDPVRDFLANTAGLFALSDDPEPLERLLEEGIPPASMGLLHVRPARSASEEARVFDAARRLGLPRIADLDASFLDPASEPVLRLTRALQRGTDARAIAPVGDRRLLDPRSAAGLFPDAPEAIDAAARMAEECEVDILPSEVPFPMPDLAPGETPLSRLATRAQAALQQARGAGRLSGHRYDARLERELRVIEETGIASWLLGVEEVVGFARRSGIQVMSRGSAVGSLVVHLLAAGPVDPIESGLLFERFLRPGRGSPPDIDLDLPSRRREEVIAWVLGRWGSRAAAVGAHQRFGARSARREAGLATGGVRVPDQPELPAGWERLIGAPRGLSVHPAGVVLSDDPISDFVPLQRAPKGIPVTQIDGRSLDALGIVKLDLLGNRCLDEIDRAIAIVSCRKDTAARALARDGIGGIPLDDRSTLRRLACGDTVGCVQIETPATRRSLRRRGIGSIADLTVALAAVRPGPAGKGPVFEEDVMRSLARAGGITLEEADEWRAEIVATGEDPAALADLQARFVRDASYRGGDPASAAAVWSNAARFARYAFSKAHASSAALLAYRAAFLRTWYPREFGCAVLDHHGGAYPRRTIAAEVARWGAPVHPPSVNASGAWTAPDAEGGIRLGLVRIRGLTRRSLRGLLHSRNLDGPFRALAEMVERVRPTITELEALVLSGACDELRPLTPEGYPFVHEAAVEAVRRRADPASPDTVPGWIEGDRAALVERYRRLVRARNELRYLGSMPSGHPLEILRPRATGEGCRTIATILESPQADEVRIAALPAATRRIDTSHGPLRFVTWEDETGLLESELGSAAAVRFAKRFETGRAFLVQGRVRRYASGAVLQVRALAPFTGTLDGAPAHRVSPRTEPARPRG